jgi:pimeloyl-ACP methyl ester carboxylesterase
MGALIWEFLDRLKRPMMFKTAEATMSNSQHLITRTPDLDIEYLLWNPAGVRTVVLVHGWPDAPRTWNLVAEIFVAHGWRVVAPALRGFAGTRFRSADTPRSGQLSVLGRDLLQFLESLQIKRSVLVGHDWGARAVANAVGLSPQVASHLCMLSVGYGTNDPNQVLGFEQARNYWYHWFMATSRGADAIENDSHAFAKIMWDTWSPSGWYELAEFEATAKAFDNPDWAQIVLHSYRHRWGHAAGYTECAADEAKLTPTPMLSTPTLVLHGLADGANHPDSSAGKDAFFTSTYERVLLSGVGHFPQREAADRVAAEILRFVEVEAV